MNKDTIKGAAKEAEGAMKKTAGRAVGNERLEAEGMAEQAAGKIQKSFGEAKDTVRKGLKN
ncbi:hypothetical protein BH11PSE2_BH11PSE2_06570 [soil metagenome]